MTSDPADELDERLDRLLETAYEALARDGDAGATRAVAAEPARPDRIGPYAVTGLLGRGGTSVVWKGVDPQLGREIAIKVLDARHAPGGELARRFLDEARRCSRLEHPGVVPIHAAGELEDGRPWFTMRVVDGETLAARLGARGDPAERQQHFLELLARVCDTVAFAHARGVVHGDLKPANVMVGAYGQVHVLDWGFSRLLGAPAERTGGAGTPAFMAPEQAAAGGAIDARTDVFGLGGILCVILTGEPPLTGGSRSELRVRAARGSLEPARERLLACGADPELVQLALACLDPAPAARPADAAAVGARLSSWRVSLERRSRELELAAARARVEAREQRRIRVRTVALAALAVASAGVFAWMRIDGQARRYEARTAVLQAVERARGRHAGASLAGDERIRWLGEAAFAAQQARTFAGTLGDPQLQRETDELARRCEADRDAAVADAAMVHWLEDFPSHLDLTADELDTNFAARFRAYGVDVATLPADAAAAELAGRAIAPALARALDDWGAVRRQRQGAAGADWRRFHELALAIDRDAARSTVRRAVLADDRAALLRLADDTAVAGAGGDTLDLLANALDRAGARAAAIRVWQRANEREPGNVRVIHSLAVHHFGATDCPPWGEMVRLFTAGVALRPHSAHLWTDLAHTLVGAGDVAAAEAALRRAVDLDPTDERAHASLIDLLRCRCRPAEALADSAGIAARADDGAAWRVHGDAQLAEGHVEAATAAYRRAVVRAPTAAHHERLAQALLALGDAGGAEAACRAALAGEPGHAGAQLHLGLALRGLGRFEDAVDALDRGRELGGDAWAARARGWLDETERAAALARAPSAPADPGAAARQAAVLHLSGDALAAARRYEHAFAAAPSVLDGAFLGWHADRAALAAAAAALQPDADVAAATHWSERATAWQRAAFARARGGLESGREAPHRVRLRLAAWRHAPDLAAVLPALAAELDALAAAADAPMPVRVLPPFDAAFAYHRLGVPDGVLTPLGGLMVDPADPDVLWLVGHAQRRTACIHHVALRRDAAGHVDGFRGGGRVLASAPFADGGLAPGPRGALAYTRHPQGEIGWIERGAPGPNRVATLGGPTPGGLGRVRDGVPGAGRWKLLSWPSGGWFDAVLDAGGDVPALHELRQVATLGGGPDGFVHVPAGSEPFSRPTLLVAEWSAHTIAAYDVDANGDPLPPSRRTVATGCRGVVALALDAGTGDVLVSTWRADGTEELGVLRRRPR
jgi:tetratricopeptide (TPR) repeat protein